MRRIDSVCEPPVRYTIVIEKAPKNCAAYAPDLPGCVAAAHTHDEVFELMREAIEFHLEGCDATAFRCLCPKPRRIRSTCRSER